MAQRRPYVRVGGPDDLELELLPALGALVFNVEDRSCGDAEALATVAADDERQAAPAPAWNVAASGLSLIPSRRGSLSSSIALMSVASGRAAMLRASSVRSRGLASSARMLGPSTWAGVGMPQRSVSVG